MNPFDSENSIESFNKEVYKLVVKEIICCKKENKYILTPQIKLSQSEYIKLKKKAERLRLTYEKIDYYIQSAIKNINFIGKNREFRNLFFKDVKKNNLLKLYYNYNGKEVFDLLLCVGKSVFLVLISGSFSLKTGMKLKPKIKSLEKYESIVFEVFLNGQTFFQGAKNVYCIHSILRIEKVEQPDFLSLYE